MVAGAMAATAVVTSTGATPRAFAGIGHGALVPAVLWWAWTGIGMGEVVAAVLGLLVATSFWLVSIDVVSMRRPDPPMEAR
jgi:hypothetical protein